MASFTASRAASSLGGSEMWGNPLNFNGTARSAPPNVSTPSALKTVAIFSKKPIPRPPQFLPPTMSSPSDCKRFQDCFSTMDSAIKDSPMRSLILPWRGVAEVQLF